MKHSTDKTIASILGQAQAAKLASRPLGQIPSETKNRALQLVASNIKTNENIILEANNQDVRNAKKDELGEEIIDKLLLTPARLETIIQGIHNVISLPDPVGEIFDGRVLPNGLEVARRRVPLGVIAVIYEARPDVTIEIPSLCLKSGNAVLLRGGKEALQSNKILASLFCDAMQKADLPPESVQFVESTDRSLVAEILKLKAYIDLTVPRGGKELIAFVANNATMPTVTGGRGVNHLYVDKEADIDIATKIAVNSKTQRPAACNALDGLLVHHDVAHQAILRIGTALTKAKVALKCDAKSLKILKDNNIQNVSPATSKDWGTEFLANIAAVKIVKSMDDAMQHIELYGTRHSEVIVTTNYATANRFVREVDAAAVFVNASMRFNDGGQLGLGAEVVISTDKFPARGPIGLRELTAYKWTIFGEGHIRV